MMIWIDKKSSMLIGKQIIKAGDVIPAGILSDAKIEKLKKQKKIRANIPEAVPKTKTVELYGMPVEAVKTETEPEPVKVEEEKPKPSRGRPKSAGPAAWEKQETDSQFLPELAEDADAEE